MINGKRDCFATRTYVSVQKENASVCRRGINGEAWERPNDTVVVVIITSRINQCKSFCGVSCLKDS